MSHTDLVLAGRIGVGFVIAFALGFERQVRGSPAGDRTFALIGLAATAVTAVTARSSPQAVAGVITGVGFIGGGVVFHGEGGLIRGVTTAATVFAAAGTGIVVGYGHLVLGLITAATVLLILELQHLPVVRVVDASRHFHRFKNDREYGPVEHNLPPVGSVHGGGSGGTTDAAGG